MPGPDMNVWRRLLADLDRPLPRRTPAGPGALRPASFARFSDPMDRYTFMYPSSWTLKDGASPLVASLKLGLFARVDFLPLSGEIGSRLEARFPGLRFRSWRKGTPARGEGLLSENGRSFLWTSWLFEPRGARIVFSTGALAEDGRPGLSAYRRNILAAVRRSFRLSGGLLTI